MSVNKVNKTTGDLSLLAGGTLFADSPIGSIIPYGGATAPTGWFICDGTELVRATYPELFAVIGTSFGTPSDNTKFKLPDLREATTKGVGLTGKSNNHMDADGLALGEFIDDRIQEHTHYAKFTDEEGLLAAAGAAYGIVVRDPAGQLTGINASGRFGATTEVKAVGVNYIIKAVSVGVPADFMSAVDNAVDEAISDIGTADITESSALANLGTAANATQHDINVAIDGVIEDIIKWETLDTSGVSLSQSGAQFSRLNVKKNKMLFVIEGEINSATLTIASTTTLAIRLPNNYPSLGMNAVGALQFWVGTSNESSGYAYSTGGNDIFLFSNSDNDPVSGATLRFSIIVPLANS